MNGEFVSSGRFDNPLASGPVLPGDNPSGSRAARLRASTSHTGFSMPDNTNNGEGLPATGRRGLLRNAGLGAAIAGVAAAGFPRLARADAAPQITDVDILNFALNLEYLEAEFYLNAVFGHGLRQSQTLGTGKHGPVTGGAKVPFANKYVHAYAQEIANDESNHVNFLRSALGSSAVARPAIDLATSFTTLARAAGVVGPNGTFNPFENDETFLLGSFIFEDVGVTAYLGAAALITDKAYLTAAGGILAVEAYHAAAIREQIIANQLSPQADLISALRAQLSGAQDDQGTRLNGKANLVPTDANSLAFPRTTDQVLNIVYGGGSGSGYLFFPNKLNGTIT